MPDLKDMKREQREDLAPQESVYPHGLTLHVDEESMRKLGLESLPLVGSEMHLAAVVRVTRVSQEDTPKGKERNMALQVEQMAVAPKKEDKQEQVDTQSEAAAVLYPEQSDV